MSQECGSRTLRRAGSGSMQPLYPLSPESTMQAIGAPSEARSTPACPARMVSQLGADWKAAGAETAHANPDVKVEDEIVDEEDDGGSMDAGCAAAVRPRPEPSPPRPRPRPRPGRKTRWCLVRCVSGRAQPSTSHGVVTVQVRECARRASAVPKSWSHLMQTEGGMRSAADGAAAAARGASSVGGVGCGTGGGAGAGKRR